MSVITLKYNSRNEIARKTIDYILSLGVFETDVTALPDKTADIKTKAAKAVQMLQKQSVRRGTDKLTLKEINGEIRETRKMLAR